MQGLCYTLNIQLFPHSTKHCQKYQLKYFHKLIESSHLTCLKGEIVHHLQPPHHQKIRVEISKFLSKVFHGVQVGVMVITVDYVPVDTKCVKMGYAQPYVRCLVIQPSTVPACPTCWPFGRCIGPSWPQQGTQGSGGCLVPPLHYRPLARHGEQGMKTRWRLTLACGMHG